MAKTDHRAIHERVIKLLMEVEQHIDRLKEMGPHPLDGDNALKNIAERCRALADRTRH